MNILMMILIAIRIGWPYRTSKPLIIGNLLEMKKIEAAVQGGLEMRNEFQYLLL